MPVGRVLRMSCRHSCHCPKPRNRCSCKPPSGRRGLSYRYSSACSRSPSAILAIPYVHNLASLHRRHRHGCPKWLSVRGHSIRRGLSLLRSYPGCALPLSSGPDGIPDGWRATCPAAESSSENGRHPCQTPCGRMIDSRRWSSSTVCVPGRREPVGRYLPDRTHSCCCHGICLQHWQRGWLPVGYPLGRNSCASSTSWKPGSC